MGPRLFSANESWSHSTDIESKESKPEDAPSACLPQQTSTESTAQNQVALVTVLRSVESVAAVNKTLGKIPAGATHQRVNTGPSEDVRIGTNESAKTLAVKGKTLANATTAKPPKISWWGRARFTNWGGNIKARPANSQSPRTLSDLQNIIRDNTVVRAVGKGHSFSPVATTDGVMVCMNKLDAVLAVDRQRGTVKVEGGIGFEQLNEALAAQGLALRTAPAHPDMTVAGAVATASHGTGLRHGSFADEVVSMEVLDSRGVLHTVSDPETLKAMRGGMGALGIVYSLTLRTEPRHNVEMVREVMDEDTAFANAVRMARENEHVDMYWSLYPKQVYVRRWNATSKAEKMPSKLTLWLEQVKGGPLASMTMGLARIAPKLRNKLAEQAVSSQPTSTIVGPCEKIAHYTLGSAKVVMTGFSVPLAHTQQAMAEIRAALEETGYVPIVPFVIRFVGKGAGTTLGHVGNEDRVTIDLVSLRKQSDTGPFMESVRRRLTALGGKQHLGKIAIGDPFGSTKPQLSEFKKVQAFFDPDNKFTNEYVSNLLDTQ